MFIANNSQLWLLDVGRTYGHDPCFTLTHLAGISRCMWHLWRGHQAHRERGRTFFSPGLCAALLFFGARECFIYFFAHACIPDQASSSQKKGSRTQKGTGHSEGQRDKTDRQDRQDKYPILAHTVAVCICVCSCLCFSVLCFAAKEHTKEKNAFCFSFLLFPLLFLVRQTPSTITRLLTLLAT